jgi:L-asparaginase II
MARNLLALASEMSTLAVESRRGNILESLHRVSVAVVDTAGRLVAHAGNAAFLTCLRSASKPFQAIPLVADGAFGRFGLGSEDLALACASHNSEPRQVEGVRGFLERIGCSESDLACGPHRPLWRDLALPSEVRGFTEVPRVAVASNCSGKHTGMLAVARHAGWATAGYHLADHPVQGRCRDEVARWAAMAPGQLGTAVDGCGVICFWMPLERMGRAFAALGSASDEAARAVAAAMTAHPDLVAGRGRLCTALMRAYPGKVLAKVGAEGVYGVALPDRGLGVAIKVESGHAWGACLALLAVLEQLGLEPSPRIALAPYTEVPLRNTRGDVVGAMRAAGDLTFV